MSSLEAAIKFFQSYPSWAKLLMLAGLVLTFGVAVLAPRTSSIDAEAKTAKRASLKIHGVDDLTLPDGAMVRVNAIVNGVSFTYPSLAGVEWLDVGPTMSSQTFALEPAGRYDVRFELHLKVKGSPAPARRFVSQETAAVSTVPFTSEYRVYPVRIEGETVARAAHPGATIRYSIEAGN